MTYRIGQGYDIHPLVEGRKLVLGGEEIPFDLGLGGFSDADVVLHALGDALLGAAGLGDLGAHFPPGDSQWRDADSTSLVRQILDMLEGRGYQVVNCDLTVIAEAPKLLPFRDRIRQRIADLLTVSADVVSFKATTHEGLGPIGRGEGIAALAVVLIQRS